jgi:hypothetical protein
MQEFLKICAIENPITGRFGEVNDKFVLDGKAFSGRGFWGLDTSVSLLRR